MHAPALTPRKTKNLHSPYSSSRKPEQTNSKPRAAQPRAAQPRAARLDTPTATQQAPAAPHEDGNNKQKEINATDSHVDSTTTRNKDTTEN
jgi:hypothetical protein